MPLTALIEPATLGGRLSAFPTDDWYYPPGTLSVDDWPWFLLIRPRGGDLTTGIIVSTWLEVGAVLAVAGLLTNAWWWARAAAREEASAALPTSVPEPTSSGPSDDRLLIYLRDTLDDDPFLRLFLMGLIVPVAWPLALVVWAAISAWDGLLWLLRPVARRSYARSVQAANDHTRASIAALETSADAMRAIDPAEADRVAGWAAELRTLAGIPARR